MTPRRLAALAFLLLAVIGAFVFRSHPPEPTAAIRNPPPASTPPPPATLESRSPNLAPFDPAEFPLVAGLNAPDSTIAHDLDLLQQLLDAWRTNFPREGNPVGENFEITAALLGDNALGLALLPKKHPALNARGELCDRWGTPFWFHALSGERMEIHSAGPDRAFATADDVAWTPQ